MLVKTGDYAAKNFSFFIIDTGLGYLQNGDKKSFHKTIAVFFGIIIVGTVSRAIVSFWGCAVILFLLVCVYIFAAIDATLKTIPGNNKIKTTGSLKILFSLFFFLITGLSLANRRTVMGLDVMSMAVGVMQPTILPGEKFLIDTWIYKMVPPKRGDLIAHTFNGQAGVYLNRIVAIEMDRVTIKDGTVFINGQILNEPYVLPANALKPQSMFMKLLIIPEGHYFVMGDNRDASFGDSRFSGTITRGNIIGKVTDIIYSQNKSIIGTTLK